MSAVFRFADYNTPRQEEGPPHDKAMRELIKAFTNIHRIQLSFHTSDWNKRNYMFDYNEINRTTMVLLSMQFEARGYNFLRCVEGTYFMSALYGEDLYAYYNLTTRSCFTQCRTPCYCVLVNTEKHDGTRYQFKFDLGCLHRDPTVFMLIHQYVPTFKLIVLRTVLAKIKSGVIEGDVGGLLDTLRHEVANVSIQDIEDIDDNMD